MVSKCNYKLVSFDINCKVSIALTDLGIKQETYLFDWDPIKSSDNFRLYER